MNLVHRCFVLGVVEIESIINSNKNSIYGVVKMGGRLESLKKMIQSFKDLQIWNRSVDLSIEIYQATATFPKSELFGLTSQIRRVGFHQQQISLKAGAGKPAGLSPLPRYLPGSLAELYTHLEISRRLDFIPDLSP